MVGRSPAIRDAGLTTLTSDLLSYWSCRAVVASATVLCLLAKVQCCRPRQNLISRSALSEEKLAELVSEFPDTYDADDLEEVVSACKKLQGKIAGPVIITITKTTINSNSNKNNNNNNNNNQQQQ